MKFVTYCGAYSDARHQGIHVVETDAVTGAMRPLSVVEGIRNPTYLALNRLRTRLYCVQALAVAGRDGATGAVAVYAAQGGALECLGVRATGTGSVPCHVALDPSERALLFAEYAGAVAGVFALRDDGSFEEGPPVTVRHVGRGPDPERQQSAHAHCAMVTPDGRWLCVCDLGLDRVKLYDFSSWREGLRSRPERDIVVAGGAGPRHMVFHPNGRLAYLLNELDSTVVALAYDGQGFTTLQTRSALPDGFAGASKAAAIKVSEDGRFLFASNRGHDSIACFAIDPAGGALTRLAISPLTGRFPRDFEMAPGDRVMLAGHKLSDEIGAYAFDPATGRFAPLPGAYHVFQPTCIRFGGVSTRAGAA